MRTVTGDDGRTVGGCFKRRNIHVVPRFLLCAELKGVYSDILVVELELDCEGEVLEVRMGV